MAIIYHLVPESYHLAQATAPLYYPPTFKAEGFVHCTGNRSLVLIVANNYFAETTESLLVYHLDEAKVTAPIRYEAPSTVAGSPKATLFSSMILFPHIYGPINPEAIVSVEKLQRSPEKRWVFGPEEISYP